jgi:hypothetical protein
LAVGASFNDSPVPNGVVEPSLNQLSILGDVQSIPVKVTLPPTHIFVCEILIDALAGGAKTVIVDRLLRFETQVPTVQLASYVVVDKGDAE